MKTLLAVLMNVTLMMVSGSLALGQNESGKLADNWLGTLDVGGTKLRLVLKIQVTSDGYAATFDSVDQAATDLPIDSVSLTGNKMSFVATKFRMSYEGTLNDKGDEITGTFKQGTGSTPMIFTRIRDVPTITRRQDPKKPYPYGEEHSEGGMIAPMVAIRSRDVAFIVLLAGLGQRGEDVVTRQTELIQKAHGADTDTIARGTAMLKKIHTIVKTENDENRREQLVKEEIARHLSAMNETQRKAFRPIESGIRSAMPMYRLPWFRYSLHSIQHRC